ncbi:hypothetical protein NSQ59_07520 [Margalitia sp. FSL K6-0131]|uniref:hypothetical protein n=1 Tax=Margalitia sp. FSL K6-0131 TaxID=2954604 RepID=UPI0030FCBBCB
MWILVNENNEVETINYLAEKPSDEFIEYNGVVPVIVEEFGKRGFHYYNGSSIEVRYESRPLTTDEKLQQFEENFDQAVMELTMAIAAQGSVS